VYTTFSAAVRLEGLVEVIPQWRLLAIGSVVLALLSLALTLIDAGAPAPARLHLPDGCRFRRRSALVDRL
jgi:hypothetical protein